MKRSEVIILVILVAVAMVVPYLLATNIINKNAASFSDHPTSIIYNGKRYHILPESKLKDDIVILLDKTGKSYYVLSEEKLRLLGPKLLRGDE